nr:MULTISPECIES: TonB-dependent receptor [Butyricimonas]
MKDVTLNEIIAELKKQTNYDFFYNSELAKSKGKISINVKDKEVTQLLDEILPKLELEYAIQQNLISIRERKTIQLINVTGKVTDEKGDPIAGATVIIHGTTQGVATDADGRYSLPVKADDILQVSFIGYKTETVPVKGKTKVNITLNPTAENIEEVTVVAFGTQKKESVVGSITTVRPMDLKTSSSDLTAGFVGKIAGVIGWKQSGLPVALTEEEMNTKFYIRGVTSFQSKANYDPLILLDGVEASKLDLARIAPEDIESFSVMKDASATAMYGARGANGVILVTTKKGEEGSVYTTARYEMVTSMPTKEIEVVNPIDYMRYYNQALISRSNSATPKYSVEHINRTASGKYPSWVYPANDWYKTMFKKQNVNHYAGVSIRGGSKVIQYYASVNYNYDQGMLKTDRLNQFDCNISNHQIGFRTNLNINLHAGIKLIINSSTTLDKYHGPLVNTQTVYSYAFNASPVDFAPLYPGDETYGWPHLRFGTTSAGTNGSVNPYALVQLGYNERTRYSTINKAEYIQNLSFLVKGLELRLSASLVQSGLYNQAFKTTPYFYYLGSYDQETGKHTLVEDAHNNQSSRTLTATEKGASSDTRITYEGRLYHTAAWGDHSTSLTGVFQMYERTFSPVSDVLNGQPQRNLNYSARASYGYKDRYFIEASGSYNGSERFAKNNRMGFFPSIGGAWVASSEKWMQPIAKIISYLKFRLSYGRVGNDGIISTPRYVYLPQLGTINSSEFRGTVAASQGTKDPVPYPQDFFYRKAMVSYANEQIQWEVAETTNLGIETKFFNGLFELQADIYQEIRHNIISQRVIIPATIGIEAPPLDNIGSTRSRGFDISSKIQHSFSNDFWIILNGTLTYNKVTYKNIEEAINTPDWQRKAGKEISQSIGYIAEGLFRDQAEIDNSPRQDGDVMPGDIKYRDVNGDGTISVEDAVFIGYPENPRLVYGFSGFINYKNWEFNFSFQGSGKRSFFMNPVALSPFYRDHAMLKVIADDHWSEDNMAKKTFWPRLSTYSIAQHNPEENWYNQENTEVRKSTYFMRECKFLRCTALSLAYNLPKKWLNKINLQNAKLSFTTNNPFCFTNFKIWDVELGNDGFNYPIQKTYSVSLSVNF